MEVYNNDDTELLEVIPDLVSEGIIAEETFRAFVLDNSAKLPLGLVIFAYYQIEEFLEHHPFGKITIYQFSSFLYEQVIEILTCLQKWDDEVDEQTLKLILEKYLPEGHIYDELTFRTLQNYLTADVLTSLNIGLSKLEISYEKHTEVTQMSMADSASAVEESGEMFTGDADDSTQEFIPFTDATLTLKDLDRVGQSVELNTGFVRYLRHYLWRLSGEQQINIDDLEIDIDDLLVDISQMLRLTKDKVENQYLRHVAEIDSSEEAESMLRQNLLGRQISELFPGSISGAYPDDAHMFLYMLMTNDLGMLASQMEKLKELLALPAQQFTEDVPDITINLEKALLQNEYFTRFKSIVEKKLPGRPRVQEAVNLFLNIAENRKITGMTIYFLCVYIIYRAEMEAQIAIDKEEGLIDDEDIDYSLGIGHIWDYESDNVLDLIGNIKEDAESEIVSDEALKDAAFNVFYSDVSSFLEEYLTKGSITYSSYTQILSQISTCRSFFKDRINAGLNA